jgi:FMN phosphatase YigB (HAD superfamily)
VATRAILFDLGNTLVSYYTSSQFPAILRKCLHECIAALGSAESTHDLDEVCGRAQRLNQERTNLAVNPLRNRLRELFGQDVSLDDVTLDRLCDAFLKPIFAMARRDPSAKGVLGSLRSQGIKTAIVSNTPWGSPATAWRAELARHELLDAVDATVFCMDVGWRKRHRAPFDRALSLLAIQPGEAIFVGDDHRWDVNGATNAGIRPVLFATSEAPLSECETIRRLEDILALAGTGS